MEKELNPEYGPNEPGNQPRTPSLQPSSPDPAMTKNFRTDNELTAEMKSWTWEKYWDDEKQMPYYFNRAMGYGSWEVPEFQDSKRSGNTNTKKGQDPKGKDWTRKKVHGSGHAGKSGSSRNPSHHRPHHIRPGPRATVFRPSAHISTMEEKAMQNMSLEGMQNHFVSIENASVKTSWCMPTLFHLISFLFISRGPRDEHIWHPPTPHQAFIYLWPSFPGGRAEWQC